MISRLCFLFTSDVVIYFQVVLKLSYYCSYKLLESWFKIYIFPFRVKLFYCTRRMGTFIWGQTKNMCVSGYRPSPSLGHRPWFFYRRFWFFTINLFFSQRNVFSFKSIFVATYIKNNFTKSIFVTFARSGQHVSRDQTVSHWKWRNNEPWHRVTDWKMSIKQFCFYKTYFWQTKLFQKIKK